MEIPLSEKEISIANRATQERNAQNPNKIWTVEEWIKNIVSAELKQTESAQILADRTLLIPVADEILLADPDKRLEAIQAALSIVRN